MNNSTITQGFLDHRIFNIVSQTAAELGVRAFVIGGYVRDCFLGRPSKDIDIVVEGSGIELAEAVGAAVHSNVSVFKNFGTAMLKFKGVEIEFVGARKESYRRDSRRQNAVELVKGVTKCDTLTRPDPRTEKSPGRSAKN